MDLELRDKVVFVSGSSRGIGKGIVRAFLREGARVAINGRDAGALTVARDELAAFGTVVAVRADLRDEEAATAALDATEAALGPLDAVVANVGSGRGTPGLSWEAGEVDRLLAQNLTGALALSRVALARLTARGAGSLTLIASIAGMESIGAPVGYSAAKAGLIAAAKAMARAAGPSGVRVNAIAPGNILFPDGTWDAKRRADPEGVRRMLDTEVALKRFGTPEDVGDLAVFLASARAAFVTGATVVADGGQTRGF